MQAALQIALDGSAEALIIFTPGEQPLLRISQRSSQATPQESTVTLHANELAVSIDTTRIRMQAAKRPTSASRTRMSTKAVMRSCA